MIIYTFQISLGIELIKRLINEGQRQEVRLISSFITQSGFYFLIID